MLRIRDVSFAYRTERILNAIDVSCQRGEFTSFLGASGSGKSTLLRLVAGLERPSSGGIDIDCVQAEQGFVFQKPTLCPWRTALENVELALQLRGVAAPQRRQKAFQTLESVGLREADVQKRPAQLSGGMRMRVSLARAFVLKPRLMMMDEPFSALDEVLRQQLCETTMRLWTQEQWTTLFVTHNVGEAVFLSQRIHILSGSPATITHTFDIPWQERPYELRFTPEFLSLVSEVSRQLRDAVESRVYPTSGSE